MAKSKSTKTDDAIHRVNAQLRPFLIAIDELHEDPDNAREHDERNSESIAKSYEQFGQQKPIVCNGNGKIVAGSGQLAAARDRLGWTHIACIKFDDDNDAAQLAFAIADNKTAELATWNYPMLIESFATLQNDQDLLDATGFAEFEIKPLLSDKWEPPTDEEKAAKTKPEPDGGASVRFNGAQWQTWLKVRATMNIANSAPDSEAMMVVFEDWLSD